MFDDIFPKQSLGPTPKNEMRQTMDKVGTEGFRTQIVQLPNGDTALYRSKGGNPEFILQKKPVTISPPEVSTGLYSIRYVLSGTPDVYVHTIAGSVCTEAIEVGKQFPRRCYWQGTAVSVPIRYNGPRNNTWNIKFGLYGDVSAYSEPFVAYRKIGAVTYRREIELSTKGTLMLREKLHPAGTQVYYRFLGYLHDTPADLVSLAGSPENDNRFMSLQINASGNKARCLARPTAGGNPPLHLFEYDLDARTGVDLGVAITYSETTGVNSYSGSAEHTWATGYVGDAVVDLKAVTSSTYSATTTGMFPSPVNSSGTYSGSFSLTHNGTPLFTVTQSASSVFDETYANVGGSYYSAGTSACETVSFQCFLLYANLAHGFVCVRVIHYKDTFVGGHTDYQYGGGYSPAYAGSQTHAWDNTSEIRVYKNGTLIYSSDEYEGGAHGNSAGTNSTSAVYADLQAGAGFVGAQFRLSGTQGGASNSNPFGYAFFIGLASGAVRKDGNQIAIVHMDWAFVLTKNGASWVVAKMPSMADNGTQAGNLIKTNIVAYDYDSQVIT